MLIFEAGKAMKTYKERAKKQETNEIGDKDFIFEDYPFSKLGNAIQGLINQDPFCYGPETIDELKKAVETIDLANIYARNICELVLDTKHDDDEELFLVDLKEDLDEYQNDLSELFDDSILPGINDINADDTEH